MPIQCGRKLTADTIFLLLWMRILGQNTRTDVDSTFQDPHISGVRTSRACLQAEDDDVVPGAFTQCPWWWACLFCMH